MSEMVCSVCDEVKVCSFYTTQESVNSLNECLDVIDVLPLAETSDVVGLCDCAVMEAYINCTSMIYYIEQVAHLFVLAVY